MGSPDGEPGRDVDEDLHQVTLTRSFHIGVFEVTQKQWELVIRSNPARYQGDGRPVEQVSYDMIRGAGTAAGAGWPAHGHTVDASSFLGRCKDERGLDRLR